MSKTTGTTPSSAWDHTDPTWDDLATEAEELGFPLFSCRKLLELVSDGTITDVNGHLCDFAEALIALIDKADSKRSRLVEHLDRLAKSERTGVNQDQPGRSAGRVGGRASTLAAAVSAGGPRSRVPERRW
ncbi:MAG: hypothetical protein ACT4QB_10535 [Gammaproteobacteria bacterium]